MSDKDTSKRTTGGVTIAEQVCARRSSTRRGGDAASVAPVASGADRHALREHRLDLVDAKRRRLWKNSLRITQLVHCSCIAGAVGLVVWQAWAYWAAGLAAVFSCAVVWGFAKWMAPREERLRRFMVALGKRRRMCVVCGYRLHDQDRARCPECGADFDPRDDRHILAQETLHLYSHRGRVMSVVNIVFVLLWVCALVRHDAWLVHLGLAAALFVTLGSLNAWWNHQSSRQRFRNTRAHTPSCAGCRVALHAAARSPHAPIPQKCPQCQRSLSYGEVFVRPDIRHLPDRRANAMQCNILLLRWVSLVAMFVGLSLIVEYRTMVPQVAVFGSGRMGVLLNLMLPLLAWVFLVVFTAKRMIVPLRRRMKLLFAQVVPHCRRCHAVLAGEPVGAACPGCGRPVDPVDIHG